MLTHAKQGSADLSKTVRGFGNSLGAFNSFLNELAYKPKGSRQSYLFYLPWLNHNTNATFNLDDPAGPISRGLIMISCNGTELAAGAAAGDPYIQTVLRGANVPRKGELPPIPPSKEPGPRPAADQEPNEQARPQHNPAPRHRRLRALLLRHPALPLDHLRRADPVQGEAV